MIEENGLQSFAAGKSSAAGNRAVEQTAAYFSGIVPVAKAVSCNSDLRQPKIYLFVLKGVASGTSIRGR